MAKQQTFSHFWLYFCSQKKQMKNTMNCSVREMRKQDVINSFYESYKELKKTRPFATQNEVIEHAVKSEAPRFYVTFENARRFGAGFCQSSNMIIHKNQDNEKPCRPSFRLNPPYPFISCPPSFFSK